MRRRQVSGRPPSAARAVLERRASTPARRRWYARRQVPTRRAPVPLVSELGRQVLGRRAIPIRQCRFELGRQNERKPENKTTETGANVASG